MLKHGMIYPAIFIIVILVLITAVWPVMGQQTAKDNSQDSLPISLLLDSVMSSHEQDIKERMFDYGFDHAIDGTQQASLVKARNDELKAAMMERQAFLRAFNNSIYTRSLSAEQLQAIFDDVKARIDRMTSSSNKLEEKSSKIKKNNNENKNTDTRHG